MRYTLLQRHSWSDSLNDITLIRQLEMMEASLGDEIVALDAAGGQCFGFNSVATDIWRALEKPRSLADLRHELMANYDVAAEECLSDLRQFVDEMVEMGLIRRVDAHA